MFLNNSIYKNNCLAPALNILYNKKSVPSLDYEVRRTDEEV